MPPRNIIIGFILAGYIIFPLCWLLVEFLLFWRLDGRLEQYKLTFVVLGTPIALLPWLWAGWLYLSAPWRKRRTQKHAFTRLVMLEELKNKGLITATEYEQRALEAKQHL